MARKPIVAGNWKMHLDHLEAISLVQKTAYHLDPGDYEAVEIVVIPPFTALRSVQTLIEGDHLPIGIGAQTCHWESSGAYTGEISPSMLVRLQVRYVLCGHSERRALFGETDEVVQRKVRAVLDAQMTPILCVGETLEQRQSGDADDVVVAQLRAALDGVNDGETAGLVVAYEPVWAIGTGETATSAQANEMCGLVRQVVGEHAGQSAQDAVRVQYGGSVKPGNVTELMAQPDIDGALVGGASLNADDFAVIARFPRL